ncbi:hypothetical protein AX774_g6158 [Zancudomyces culisetae]|uniref:Uncharacterized protein n=1 Tax=Zancudomyces culisetae TaxID=1213189 RepID=A0A1R1PHK7_ZANCU|nr:hypothetical protein AX774_g6158 [Zancudomyces culisetae]|eukprot:OMH80409.1 hypothetical protein AX774_g6158 [Zancudomyces culisetae]
MGIWLRFRHQVLQQWSLRSQKSELVSESVLKLPDLNSLDKINKSGTMSSTPPVSATSFYNSSRSIAPGSISNNSHGVTTVGSSGISSRSGLGIFKTPLSPSNVCFSPETDHVLIAPENYGVIYDVGLGTWSEVLAPHRYPITCVDWDSTGGSILTASEDGTIRIATL